MRIAGVRGERKAKRASARTACAIEDRRTLGELLPVLLLQPLLQYHRSAVGQNRHGPGCKNRTSEQVKVIKGAEARKAAGMSRASSVPGNRAAPATV